MPDSLDVEDDDARLLRLQHLLHRANTSSAHPVPPGPATSFDFGNRETHAVAPPTELLSRLHAFLPQLEAANADLARQDPTSFNIEQQLDDSSDGQYIEMNLGLGVFDVHQPSSAHSRSQSDSSDSEQSASSSDPSGSSDSESDIDGHSNADIIHSVRPSLTPGHANSLPRPSTPNIVVLSETTTITDTPNE